MVETLCALQEPMRSAGELSRAAFEEIVSPYYELREKMLSDAEVFNVMEPSELVMRTTKKKRAPDSQTPASRGSQDKDKQSTLYASQRAQLERKMTVERQSEDTEAQQQQQTMDPEFAAALRRHRRPDNPHLKRERAREANSNQADEAKRLASLEKSHAAWMARLRSGDYEGPQLDTARYLELRGERIHGNPRHTEEYKDRCAEAVGVGEEPDRERYKHLKDADIALVRWVVRRGSGCMWLPDSPRTTVKGFLHRLVTRGPPVRRPLFRLSRPDAEWIEKAILEDVLRG